MTDFAKEARDLIDRHADYAATERGMYFINHAKFTALIAKLMKDRAEAKAAGLAEGLARAAEIARRVAGQFAHIIPANRLGALRHSIDEEIAEAILSASPPDLTKRQLTQEEVEMMDRALFASMEIVDEGHLIDGPPATREEGK